MFKYKQKVKIKDGFYKGTGEVIKEYYVFSYDGYYISYDVKLDIDNEIVKLSQSELEPL